MLPAFPGNLKHPVDAGDKILGAFHFLICDFQPGRNVVSAFRIIVEETAEHRNEQRPGLELDVARV